MHYTTNGTAAVDRTQVGFIFAKEPPKQIHVTGLAVQPRFVIPAGDPNAEVKAVAEIRQDTIITSLTPHMHVRGKDMTYTAFYPDGTSEVLLRVPKYDFNWQITYDLAKPKTPAEGHQGRGRGALRQLAGQQVQPRPHEGREMGRPDVGRDDDRVLGFGGRRRRRRLNRNNSERVTRSSRAGERTDVQAVRSRCGLAVRLEVARPRSRKVGMRDDQARHVGIEPVPMSLPPHRNQASLSGRRRVQRLVAQLRELGAPARAAPHGVVRQDRADHVDLLAGVHLMPQRLQDLPDGDALGIPPVHAAATHAQRLTSPGLQLLVIERAAGRAVADPADAPRT